MIEVCLKGIVKQKTHNQHKVTLQPQVIDPTFIRLDHGLPRHQDTHPPIQQEQVHMKHRQLQEIRPCDGLIDRRNDRLGDSKQILEACLIYFRLPDPERYVYSLSRYAKCVVIFLSCVSDREDLIKALRLVAWNSFMRFQLTSVFSPFCHLYRSSFHRISRPRHFFAPRATIRCQIQIPVLCSLCSLAVVLPLFACLSQPGPATFATDITITSPTAFSKSSCCHDSGCSRWNDVSTHLFG